MHLGSLSKRVMTYGGCGAGMRWEGSAIKCTAASGLVTAADETTAAYMAADPGADGGSCWCCSDGGTVRGEAGVVVVLVVVVAGVIWLLRRRRTPSRVQQGFEVSVMSWEVVVGHKRLESAMGCGGGAVASRWSWWFGHGGDSVHNPPSTGGRTTNVLTIELVCGLNKIRRNAPTPHLDENVHAMAWVHTECGLEDFHDQQTRINKWEDHNALEPGRQAAQLLWITLGETLDWVSMEMEKLVEYETYMWEQEHVQNE
ncbi:hypothetical protein B0H14DRAFT_2635374 [Mycena olivaceomarginata]|nr:hypothetical protein B0H14DRAFT_2635374 [Mycena olivaceomarginata]